jgi:hypothetical protein
VAGAVLWIPDAQYRPDCDDGAEQVCHQDVGGVECWKAAGETLGRECQQGVDGGKRSRRREADGREKVVPGTRTHSGRSKLRTTRRAKGATSSTVGNASTQAVSHDPIHRLMNPGWNPVETSVDVAETTSDMSPDSIKPMRAASNLLGIILRPSRSPHKTSKPGLWRRWRQTCAPS